MNHTLNRILYNFTGQWLDPWDDVANAGKTPQDYNAGLHRQVAQMRASLVGTRNDCVITDVSRWQLEINFSTMVAAGAKATILKCGQGWGIDPYFIINWQKAKQAGLKRGSYWFYDSRVEPKEQAQQWADTLKTYGFGDLPHFADYEENYGGQWKGAANFALFVKEFQRLTGLPNDKIGIYTGYFYWLNHGTRDAFWEEYWLWLAWYGHEADVIIPLPWKQDKLFAWQFTSSGDGFSYGVSSREIDLNFFVKGLAVFEALYGETTETPPQTGEEGMFRVISDNFNMALRREPFVTTTNVITTVPRGTWMDADALVPPASGGVAGDKWARVTRATVNGQNYSGYVAVIHNGSTYCRYETAPVGGANPVAKVIFTDSEGRTFEGETELTPK